MNAQPAVMGLKIPWDSLGSAKLTIHDIQVELAVSLYTQGRLSLGKALELADMSLWEFRKLLTFRRISRHYDQQDLQKDVATLKEYGAHITNH